VREDVLVSVDDVGGGGLGPFLKGATEILLDRAQQGLKLLGVVKVGQFGHPPHEIVKVALPLIGDLPIHERDGLFGDGGHEASREAFGECRPHLVKLIEPAVDVEGTVLITADDVIDHVVNEGYSGLMAGDVDLDAIGQVRLRFQ
jgi:hypothetical protein